MTQSVSSDSPREGFHPERLELARENTPDLTFRAELAQMFQALGDSTRLGILLALRDGEMCVGDLAILLGISDSAVSHQLRILRTLFMVQPRREGRSIFYSLRDEHVVQILDLGLIHFIHETTPKEATSS